MTALASYRSYQERRLAQPIGAIEPAEYEKQDRVEAVFRVKAIEEAHDRENDEAVSRNANRSFKYLVATARIFIAGDLRSPVVFDSYLEAKLNRTKATRKDRIKFYDITFPRTPYAK